MKCKCGDDITENDIERIKTFPCVKHNVPDYPRCRACLNILSFGLYRLVKHNLQFQFYANKYQQQMTAK